jgi:hypothetical protein
MAFQNLALFFIAEVWGNKNKMQDGTEAFWARVDDIGRARLDVEDKLHLKAADTLHRELLQELDRYCKPFFPLGPVGGFFFSHCSSPFPFVLKTDSRLSSAQ